MTVTKSPSGKAGDVVVLHVPGSVMTSPLRKLISALFFKCIVEEISAAHRLRPFACVGQIHRLQRSSVTDCSLCVLYFSMDLQQLT